jgi:EmrB/QacA subfamily drug resistance transporter
MAVDRPHWLLYVPHPRMPEGAQPFARRWWTLPAISLGVFMIAVDITIVGIAAPTIGTELGATAAELQWMFDAFTVVMAASVLVGSGLAERYGRKGVFQIGVAVFALGSAIAAFAGDPSVLIAGRAVSGLGAALAFPPALSVMSALFPVDERPRAIGIFAATSASGLALGPIIGGILLSEFWWGSVFLVNVPIGVITIVALGVLLPPSRQPSANALDFLGALLSLAGVGGLVYWLIEGPDQGWLNPVVIAALVIGAFGTVAFFVHELRVDHPLFDVRVLTIGAVATGALAMAMVYLSMNSILLLVPQYLEYVENLTSTQAGLTLIPLGLGLGLLSPSSAGLVERFGQRTMLSMSLGLMAFGMAILALVDVWGGRVNIVVGLIPFAVGFGLVVAPATSAIMVALPVAKAGDGSAVNMISRQVGGALGVALLGSLATVAYRNDLSLSGLGLSDDQQAEVESSLSGIESVSGQLSAATQSAVDAAADAAVTVGLQWGMIGGAVLVGSSAVFALRVRSPESAVP